MGCQKDPTNMKLFQIRKEFDEGKSFEIKNNLVSSVPSK